MTAEVVFARENGWIPRVVREHGAYRLELAAGADALHQPRSFAFPVSAEHAEVIRDDLVRHLLLWSAVLPLCDAAGIGGDLDEAAAVALLDPILLGTPVEVEDFFGGIRWDRRRLIAQHADVALLEAGRLFAAMARATERDDWSLVYRYDADRDRARRGVRLGPLDEGLLKYTGRFLHGGRLPRREPGAVAPRLLPEVLAVVATAERATSGMRLHVARDGHSLRGKRDWERMERAAGAAVRDAYPRLVDDAVRTVAFLVCAEAADRARRG